MKAAHKEVDNDKISPIDTSVKIVVCLTTQCNVEADYKNANNLEIWDTCANSQEW